MSETRTTVLLSPLDWGLGHAARCVPVVQYHISLGHRVIIYASAPILRYFAERFTEPEMITDPMPSFSYGLKGIRAARLFSMVLNLKKRTAREKIDCHALVDRFKPDLIVSDNRYGFYHPDCRSVLYTHQLAPMAPRALSIGMPLVQRFLRKAFRAFDEVRVPDFQMSPGLAGALSHVKRPPLQLSYVGPMSRFAAMEKKEQQRDDNTVLIITSGPVQHRNQMAQFLVREMSIPEIKLVVVGVDPGLFRDATVTCIFSPSDRELLDLMLQAPVILARCGYSTLMDLAVLGRTAILVPTPGQTEQEYLALLHKDNMMIARDLIEAVRLIKSGDHGLSVLAAKEAVWKKECNKMINS